ncbi:MAG TPA: glycerophosphodiester phosphodiesterase [Acidimicrobiaceae bacterium]|nr:glycerophosphodiester phosphodiesterase [Acidimicrobiaceae bacterium]
MGNAVPVLFAHRGGRAHARENTLEAFHLALRLGATGLESDVWRTVDDVPVLQHDDRLGSWLRRRSISNSLNANLPREILRLTDLLATINPEIPLSLDLKDPAAGAACVEVAAAVGPTSRLWLCHPDLEILSGLRDIDRDMHLVHSTRIDRHGSALERHASDLSAAGIDAVNLPEAEWTLGLVALYRRFNLKCFGWAANHTRQINRLIHLGLDGIYGDHVDRLVDGLNQRR